MAGIMAMSMGGMLYLFSHFMGGMGGNKSKGIGGAENTKAPKLLIDNSSGVAPFVDATGHGSSQLFGSIAWDPYQTGDLGTPEHQRVTAGDVHRAHLGVLYIDEIKNLSGGEAVTLLTVMEDGQLPVALRSQFHGGDTAAMAVATEPIPCMVFLIAAGNMDSLCQIHPALMDRMVGYGKVVYMNNRIYNTEENRRKYVQFIAQETKRFNLLPFTRDACIAIIDEARKKSGRNDRLTCYFRQMISILKTSSTLAMIEKSSMVTEDHVKLALGEHCKTIQKQVLERTIEERKPYITVDANAEPKIGQIYGLAVSQIFETDNEMIGSVLPIRASIVENQIPKEAPDFTVTGVNSEEGSWVQNSIQKVRHVFFQTYQNDPAIGFTSHIDFAQEIGVDGPSAGVAMTLALISAYTKKKILQSVAITGEINIKTGDEILVTPIGGTHAKIMAAQNWGFKKVCIPQVNFEKDINPSDYTIIVVGCRTLEDYMKEVFEESATK
jgi:Lon-like ATP-dependent protease